MITKSAINKAFGATWAHVPTNPWPPRGEWCHVKWHVTLTHTSGGAYTTPYSVGIAHIPGYGRVARDGTDSPQGIQAALVKLACERGRCPSSTGRIRSDHFPTTRAFHPETWEVVLSLANDASTWYDVDSVDALIKDFGYADQIVKAASPTAEFRRIEETYRLCGEAVKYLSRCGLDYAEIIEGLDR